MKQGSECHSLSKQYRSWLPGMQLTVLQKLQCDAYPQIHKLASHYRTVNAALRPKHTFSRRKTSTVTLPRHVPISTGNSIVAAPKIKLRAAVISDEMRKSILSVRISHLFLCLPYTLSSSILEELKVSKTTAWKYLRIPWRGEKLKVQITNSAICVVVCFFGNVHNG